MTHTVRDNPRTADYPRDLFRSGAVWPNEVVILGSGPNGREAWPRITPEHCVIALNKTVLWCGWPDTCLPVADYWLCTTPYYFRYADWWDDAMRHAADCGTKSIFGWALANMVEHPDQYHHQTRPAVNPGADYTIYAMTNWDDEFRKGETEYWPHSIIPGMVRGGGTIAGHAIQIAAQICQGYWRTCSKVFDPYAHMEPWPQYEPPKIILVGIDMKGSGYADGTVNTQVDAKYKDGGFTELPMLQDMVDVIGQECKIVSWSDTALEVERE